MRQFLHLAQSVVRPEQDESNNLEGKYEEKRNQEGGQEKGRKKEEEIRVSHRET